MNLKTIGIASLFSVAFLGKMTDLRADDTISLNLFQAHLLDVAGNDEVMRAEVFFDALKTQGKFNIADHFKIANLASRGDLPSASDAQYELSLLAQDGKLDATHLNGLIETTQYKNELAASNAGRILYTLAEQGKIDGTHFEKLLLVMHHGTCELAADEAARAIALLAKRGELNAEHFDSLAIEAQHTKTTASYAGQSLQSLAEQGLLNRQHFDALTTVARSEGYGALNALLALNILAKQGAISSKDLATVLH